MKFLVRISFLLASLGSVAWADFQVPTLTGPVVDQVNLLTREVRRGLEQQIMQLQTEKGAQLQIFIVEDLEDESIEEVAIKVYDAWKLGQSQVDNGVLFIVAPNERKLRIEVGRGFEGVLPDITAKRIIADGVLPYFRKKQFEAGVQFGVTQIISAIREEPIGTPPKTTEQSSRGVEFLIVLLFVIVSIFMNRFGGRGMHGRSLGGFGGSPGWGGGSWSGGSGGGGGSWSGGGGGSSGGGSSGSW